MLQDLLCRMPLPKWKPPFWLSNTVQVVASVALVGGLTMADTYEEKKIHAVALPVERALRPVHGMTRWGGGGKHEDNTIHG